MAAPVENLLLENSMESQDRIALAVLEREVVHLDKGLSEVKAEMKSGFQRVDTEIKELRSEMKSGFQRVDAEFKDLRSQMNQKFEKVDERFVVLDSKIDNRFFWTLGALGGTAVAIVGFIVGFIYFFFGKTA